MIEVIKSTMLLVSSVCVIFTLIVGIAHRFSLFYNDVRTIEWFYPWTIEAIEHFNKEIKYRHWLTTFLCTIVGIVDTIITIPAFTLILLCEVICCAFKLIIKGIKNLIFISPKEKKEEKETDNSDLVFAYHTNSGRVFTFSYNPKTDCLKRTKGL